MEKYTILKELGRGCFGYAYKVLNNENNNIYVMKKIPKHRNSKEIMEDIKNEAKLLSKVNSEHIVKYYESFSSENSFNIVMEFVDGSNLQNYIGDHRREHKKIEEEDIYSFIVDICKGLKEIHSKNIIHKDIKPDNLFLTTNGIIKIGDFGISRQLINSRDFANTCNGPLLYMAPEEIKQNNYNTKVDIWALGCVIHELCTLNICFKDCKSILDGSYEKINENYYGHFLQNLIDLLLNQDYHKRPKASEIIDFVNSKHIPNEFLRHNNRSKNISSPFSHHSHKFTSNSRHRSNRINHRTHHTINHNSENFQSNHSNRNIFIPDDEEKELHSSFFRENRPQNFGPPNFGQASMPQRFGNNGFPPQPSHSHSRIGNLCHPSSIQGSFMPPPTPFNMNGSPSPFNGLRPSPPSLFNVRGPPSPFNLNGSSPPPPPSPFNTHGPFPPPSSPFMPNRNDNLGSNNCIIF